MQDAAVIDAVFLTWKARDHALECVAHLQGPEIASIVVVDNASTDGTAEAVRAAHPDVAVLALDAPLGLAAALNRGAQLGQAPFVLYLNDDVLALPGSVKALLAALESRPGAVAAGGRLVERDLTTQDRYRPRAFPTAATMVASLLGLDRLWPRNPWTGSHLRRPLDDRTTVEVDQPAGACLLVRRSTVERVCGWDERYWFWYEDIDFTRRLAGHGTLLYVPTAPFRHAGGATARRLSAAEGHRRFFHGVLRYSRTHLSRRGCAAVALTTALVNLTRAGVAMKAHRAAGRSYARTARGAISLLLGKAGAVPEQRAKR